MRETVSKRSRSGLAVTAARIILLVAVLIVWGAITIGIAFNTAEVTRSYQYLTVVLFLFLSHLWGLRVASVFSQN